MKVVVESMAFNSRTLEAADFHFELLVSKAVAIVEALTLKLSLYYQSALELGFENESDSLKGEE